MHCVVTASYPRMSGDAPKYPLLSPSVTRACQSIMNILLLYVISAHNRCSPCQTNEAHFGYSKLTLSWFV